MTNVTVACHYVQALTASVARRQRDTVPLLLAAGIAPGVAQDTRARIPHTNYIRLVRRVWACLDDENLGLASRPLPLGAFHYASHLMIGAPNLRKALELGTGLYHYLNPGWSVELQERDGNAEFHARLAHPEFDPDHLLAEFVLSGWHRFASWLIGSSIVLKQVDFDFSPPLHEVEYRHLFPGPRAFNQPGLRLCFSAKYLNRSILQESHSLKQYIETTPAYLLLNPVDDHSHSARVRQILDVCGGEAFPSFEDVAERLNMTTKSLRHKLKDEGGGYQKLKDVIRRDRAIHYLSNTQLTVAEVGHQIGFAETGAFIRAFKSWTGLTPGSYRSQTSHSR